MKSSHGDLRSLKCNQYIQDGGGKRQKRDLVGFLNKEDIKRCRIFKSHCNSSSSALTPAPPKAVMFSNINKFTGNTVNITIHNYVSASAKNEE